MTEAEVDILIRGTTKTIVGDIPWAEDEDHSACREFRVEVTTAAAYPLFIVGSTNPRAQALSFSLILRPVGRIYSLDIGKEHHNPRCNMVGETHKHRWTDMWRDKDAYAPTDITASANEPILAWNQFCAEAGIVHVGVLLDPPVEQLEIR